MTTPYLRKYIDGLRLEHVPEAIHAEAEAMEKEDPNLAAIIRRLDEDEDMEPLALADTEGHAWETRLHNVAKEKRA